MVHLITGSLRQALSEYQLGSFHVCIIRYQHLLMQGFKVFVRPTHCLRFRFCAHQRFD